MKPLNILIADDQPINLKLLRAELESEGHTVFDAANGLEALTILDREQVDVIISDILMPVMDGYRFCYEVRQSEAHRHLPFIVYTATYLSPSDEKLSLDLGADCYLRKPASLREILRTIEQTLQAPRREPTAHVDGADILREYNAGLVAKLEKKNVELTAAIAQLRLQTTALETAADGVVITDVRGTILWVNPAFTVTTGYTAEEAVGKTPRILKSGVHDEPFYREFWETILAGRTWRGEFANHRKDGSMYYDEHTVTPVRAADGTITHFVGVMHDMTDRRTSERDLRRVEAELRETDRRFREMLNNLELVSIMLDREGCITYCNDYVLHLTGWHREEVMGRRWVDLFIPPDRLEDSRHSFAQLLADDPTVWHHTNEILTRNGDRRLLQWNNSVLRSPNGEVIGTASIAEDVTDRRRLEQQFLRAQRLESLGTLASGIAHDLNNLLMPILMGATLLRRQTPNERSLSAIDIIERSVKRGSDLVNQVLLFARGSEGAREAVQLVHIIHEVRQIARSTFPKDIRVEVSIPGDLDAVTGDATQLSQVVLNLCVNARDAMQGGGLITISALNSKISDHYALMHGGAAGGPYVVLEVSDTGEGMPKEVADRIFDPFFTTKGVGQGTGLGLSTVQGIVTSHGGFVTVTSAPGEGCTFHVHLPALPSAHVVEQAPEQAPPPSGNGELILVVDDEASVVSMTAQTLEAFGYTVLTADDGAEAIAVYSRRHEDIQVVLTDMAMPVIDGAALIAALTRMNPAVRIIVTTGNPSAASMAKITKTGVSHVLLKPYATDHLLRTLAEVLER